MTNQNKCMPYSKGISISKEQLDNYIDLYYQMMSIDRSNRSRKKEVLQCRAALSVILCRNGFSQESVAPIIGRDRSTIHHYIRNFDRDYKSWGGYKDRVILCEQVVERIFK